MRNKNKRLAQYATELRRNMTDAEYALWYHLRNKLFVVSVLIDRLLLVITLWIFAVEN